MNHFDMKAIQYEKRFLKNVQVFLTLNGKANAIQKVTDRYVFFYSKRTRKVQKIKREILRKAIAFLLQRRTCTRETLDKFHQFNSALLGMLRMAFIEIAKVKKTIRGLLRLTLKDIRFYFGGVNRGPSDLAIVKEQDGNYIMHSYFYLRNDKHLKWLYYFRKYGLKGILLDSGEYTRYRKWLQGERIKPICIKEYASFIKRHKKVLVGWINLDLIGDAEQSRKNANYLRSEGLGEGLIEVFHCQSEWDELEKLVESDQEVIAIGGTVFLSEKKRKLFFDELFRRYPNENFHILGLCSPLLWKYPWFSSDSSSWLSARKDKELITPFGREALPSTWDVDEGLAWNAKLLAELEGDYREDKQTIRMLIPPAIPNKQLVMNF